ncbi:unnamed protein product [Mytilus edulis]|uniref:Uncharacterized protein n=1 Tax=Mytilus edulis TaxID=6550 RepID=A0A8S3QJY6_MYTED|nr:unnamed protein product [Mytilus edulis]
MRIIKQSTISRGRQTSRSVGGHVVYNTRSQNKNSSVGVLSGTKTQEKRSSGRRVFCSTQTAINTRPARDISCITKKSLGKTVSLHKNRSVSVSSSLRLSTTKSVNNGKLSTTESFHSGNVMIIRCSHSLEHPRSFVVYKSRSSSLNRIEN